MNIHNDVHTFAVCAYKESPFLEECILSLVNQSTKSNIIMSTSTDNEFIRGLSVKYDIPLYINPGKGDMQGNWNFAYGMVKTPFVTIVHQDDYYYPEFAANILDGIAKYKDIIMMHTNYSDVVNGRVLRTNLNKRIKSFINFPVRFQFFARHAFFRKLALSFGNTICCPSVTYNKQLVGESPFHSTLAMAVDWELFYDLAAKKGTFVYYKKPLTCKRLHIDSETNETIQNGARYNDDVAMFSKMWPRPLVKIIVRFYKKSYTINDFSKIG